MPIDRNKISVLHVAKSQLELDDQEYQDILKRYAGVTSSADPDMTSEGFNRVMACFKGLGFISKADLRVRGGATQSQVYAIKKLWEEITGHHRLTDDYRNTLIAFLKRFVEDVPTVYETLNRLSENRARHILVVLNKMKSKKEVAHESD